MNNKHGMIEFRDDEQCVRVSAQFEGEQVFVDTSLFPHMSVGDQAQMAVGKGLWPAPHDYDVMDVTEVRA